MICGIKIQTKIKFKVYVDGESNNKNSERRQAGVSRLEEECAFQIKKPSL